MRLPIEQLAVFAEAPFEGNPAAVCSLQTWLPDGLMQAIATENNLSETAFTVQEGDGYGLRWFTPSCEVDLCGHATLAAAEVVFAQAPERTLLRFHTRSGELRVDRDRDGLRLTCPAMAMTACAVPEGLVEALGATPEHCLIGMDLMAVFASEDCIQSLMPSMEALAAMPGRGVIVTAPGRRVDVVSRFFAPGIGIPEDPVTGSAHCSLAPYWAYRLGRSRLEARQLSKRGGRLRCEVQGETVLISGRVQPFLKGELILPSSSFRRIRSRTNAPSAP